MLRSSSVWCVLCALSLLVACDGEEGADGGVGIDATTPAVDSGRVDSGSTGTDSGPDGTDSGPDSGPVGTDSGPDGTDSGPVGTDAGPVDGGPAPVDSGVDSGTPVDAGGGVPGQCRTTADCPGISTCSNSAPGGICIGCGSSADCPGDTDCDTSFGACILDCSGVSDCHVGMRCLTRGCALRSCSDSDTCDGYECRGGFCRRWECGGGATCPSPFTCVGTICVE